MDSRREKIRGFLIQEIQKDSPAVVRAASRKFRITRQAVNRYLKQLVDEGIVAAQGNTKSRTYSLKNLVEETFNVKLSSKVHEDKIWREQVRPLLDDVRENVIRICQHGFTEILNNAIEHSEGTLAQVHVSRTAAGIRLGIEDNGVGIFNKIKREFNLDDERQAILELSKGKLTTDPSQHSGEGIFFTSRMFDTFSIFSGNLFFWYTPADGDWLLEDKEMTLGTQVLMEISLFSNRTPKEVFDTYALEQDNYGFSKTRIPVFLALYGDENLVSRSQAKRVLNRLERFKEIIFDFKKVGVIGQAFADEIFRVFQSQHPEVRLSWVNTSAEVEQMIRRAKAHNSGTR